MNVPSFRSSNMKYAYQLHYHFGCQTLRKAPVLEHPDRQKALDEILEQVALRSAVHILEKELSASEVRTLISLRPSQAPSKIIGTIKTNTSRLLFKSHPEMETEMNKRRLWGAGSYLRSVGDVDSKTVRAYIASQRQHHAEADDHSVLLAEYAHANPQPYLELRPISHAMIEYNCHLVCCPIRHVEAISPSVAQDLLVYILRIAERRSFVVLSLAILNDHIHLFSALNPTISPEEFALCVMNNTSQYLKKRDPGAFRLWEIPGFWTCSAFLRTAGAVTTNQVRGHLRKNRARY